MRLGFDVGGSAVKAVALDDGFHDLGTWPMPSGERTSFVMEICDRLVTEHRPQSLGVGLAGLVTWPRGAFVWGPHLQTLEMSQDQLTRRYEIPVVVDNDANMAALAEAKEGAGRRHDSVLAVMLGSGIGAGYFNNGELRRGGSFAGEVGHLKLRDNGIACVCGSTGCWETLVSARIMDECARDLSGAAVESGPGWLGRAAAGGQKNAIEVITRLGRELGDGLIQLILVLDPAVVVIGGAGAEAGPGLLEAAREKIAADLPGATHRSLPELANSVFGRLAGAVGAAIASQP